jgi:hypothetical protein
MALYEFTVELDDKTYNCKRFVSGQDVRRQTIKVIDVGSRDDPACYGDKLKPISAMQLSARLIAHEIIKTHK